MEHVEKQRRRDPIRKTTEKFIELRSSTLIWDGHLSTTRWNFDGWRFGMARVQDLGCLLVDTEFAEREYCRRRLGTARNEGLWWQFGTAWWSFLALQICFLGFKWGGRLAKLGGFDFITKSLNYNLSPQKFEFIFPTHRVYSQISIQSSKV